MVIAVLLGIVGVTLHADVAPGVHRIEHSFTNFYLVEDDDRLTLVDAGVPTAWEPLQAALGGLGRAIDDIEALVLTHGHFDHVGIAERSRSQLGDPRVRARERRPAHTTSLAVS